MRKSKINFQNSAFEEHGYRETIEIILEDIKDIYLSKKAPWIIGYSGGKDSSAVLQLVWLALLDLNKKKRNNPVYVISTDTLVENPVVAAWVNENLKKMKAAAKEYKLPIFPNRLEPEIMDTFWVNLIGKGYPAPRPKFRWCTSRLKINPSNAFINNIVQKSGEAVLVLGMRKSESSARARVMKKYEHKRYRKYLSQNANLPNSYVYTPIEDWTNDDVWAFLLNNQDTPWKLDNNELLNLYKGASPDNECPLVVDTGTESCGKSRFGCWVCTLVSKDSSMQAMIQNDDEKRWMLPMLEFRDRFDIKNDKKLRDFRRMTGKVQLFHDEPIPGPYKQTTREKFLRNLLETQNLVKKRKPAYIPDFELITIEELKAIRRIWVVEKHEIEDSLPLIYEDIVGEPFPEGRFDDNLLFGIDEIKILKEICGKDQIHFELTRELLDIEREYRMKARRAGLYDALESSFRKSFFDDEEDATDRARRLLNAKEVAKEEQLLLPTNSDTA